MKALFFILFTIFSSVLCQYDYDYFEQITSDYTIYWSVDSNTVHLKLVVNTTGWIGFGIGGPTSGSMPGSDILTAIVSNGTTTIADRYAMAEEMPLEDTCSNWNLVSGQESDGITTVEVTRLLDTGDAQDRPFVSGSMKVVVAYGETDVFGYHGSNRFATAISFINNTASLNEMQWQYFDIRGNYAIPSSTTTYACTTFNLPTFPSDVHIVKMEMILDPNTIQHVHHMILYRCGSTSPWFQNRLNNTELCSSMGPNDSDTAACIEVVWGYAHGVSPLVLPSNVGFRAGPTSDAIQYVNMQIHYDNPTMISGMVDTSGVRLYYITDLRPYDAGVITMGDPEIQGKPIPPGLVAAEYEYNCPEDCTNNWDNEIYAIGSFLHMHQTGSMAWTSHWRGDQYLGDTNRIEFYDFGFQMFAPINITIRPGDRLQTHCVYDTTSRTNTTYFGEPSNWEMCMDFMMYYPRLPDFPYCGYLYDSSVERNFTVCGVHPYIDYNPTQTDPVGGLNKTFGNHVGPCTVAESEEMSGSYKVAMCAAVLLLGILLLL